MTSRVRVRVPPHRVNRCAACLPKVAARSRHAVRTATSHASAPFGVCCPHHVAVYGRDRSDRLSRPPGGAGHPHPGSVCRVPPGQSGRHLFAGGSAHAGSPFGGNVSRVLFPPSERLSRSPLDRLTAYQRPPTASYRCVIVALFSTGLKTERVRTWTLGAAAVASADRQGFG